MAAGLGFKEFTTGDVLTAADANGYLASQVVMVFASAAARTSAIASPQEGMISYLKDTNATQYYSGSAWVTIGASGSPLTTKGDLYTFSTVDARLGVGTNGQYLSADSTAATGLAWATPAAAGGFTTIASASLPASSTLTLSTISSSYQDLYLIVRGYYTGAESRPYVRLNNISTANYLNYLQFSTSGTATTQTGKSQIEINDASQNFAPSATNAASIFIIHIPNYANATTNKFVNTSVVYFDNASTWRVGTIQSRFDTTSAIDRIDVITSSGGNFSGGNYTLLGAK
jgi:hypothetical protein